MIECLSAPPACWPASVELVTAVFWWGIGPCAEVERWSTLVQVVKQLVKEEKNRDRDLRAAFHFLDDQVSLATLLSLCLGSSY